MKSPWDPEAQIRKNISSLFKQIRCLTVSSWVTVGQDERLLVAVPLVLEIIDRVHNLIEDRDEADRVSRRAFAAVNTVGVGHMRLVIGRIQVPAVPTTREENLNTETTIESFSIKYYHHLMLMDTYLGQFLLGNPWVSGDGGSSRHA